MGCSDILYACQCIMHYSAIHTALDINFLCMVVHSLNPHVTILQCILTWPSSKTIVQSILYLQLFIYIHNVRVVFLWIGREQRIWESQRDSSWEFHFLNWSITAISPPNHSPTLQVKITFILVFIFVFPDLTLQKTLKMLCWSSLVWNGPIWFKMVSWPGLTWTSKKCPKLL